GKAVFTYEGKDYKMKWERSGKKLTAKGGGAELSGTVKDGVMELTDILDSGVDITLECKSIVRKASRADRNKTDNSADGGSTKKKRQKDTTDDYVEQAIGYYYGLADDGYDLDKAIACLEEVADDNGLAWYYYARCTERQGNNESRYEEAMQYYDKAIENGCLLGWVGKGDLYRSGRGVIADEDEARYCYQTAVDEGCKEANEGLGLLVEDTDVDQAADYYEKAIDGEDFGLQNLARVRLGYLHCEGDTNHWEKADPARGLALLREAADAGSGQGMHAMGYIYDNGDGVEQDYATAVQWYTEAIEKTEWPVSYHNLAVLYRDGNGVERDLEKTVEYYTKAADAGYENSLAGLGYLYSRADDYGMEPDGNLAVEYYEKAARIGMASAYTELGLLYENGELVEQDYEKAVGYYTSAMEMNDAWGTHNLASFYASGRGGLNQDADYAVSLYERALALEPENEELHEYAAGNLQLMVEQGLIDSATAEAVLNGE
ncbi:MAG: sel1 repeat family protein, partial [Lachnospiraceae bacterium]|nr:sel1 repeat family protein [Lachnospiraceae bacterium]